MSNKDHFVSAISGSLHINTFWTNNQDFNFKQLLKSRAEDDPFFSEWLNRKNQDFT